MFFGATPKTRPTKQKSRPSSTVTVGPFTLGINTVLGKNELADNEMSACVNFKMSSMGGLEIRQGITRYTASALASQADFFGYFPVEMQDSYFSIFTDTAHVTWEATADVTWLTEAPASSTADELIITKHDGKLYYLDTDKTPTYIGTLAGTGTILQFAGYVVILDGGCLKYWDKATSVLGVLYDDGTGTDGYQITQLGLTADTTIALDSVANVKAGVRFITKEWDTGYTIPLTTVSAYASKDGAPVGNVGCEIYTDAGVLVATSDDTYAAADLDVVAEKLDFTFSSGTMSPSAYYWAVITFTGGDADNHVLLHCEAAASGANCKYNDGAWKDDDTKYPLMGVKPGIAPKGKFGTVVGNRLFVAGNPDYPGFMFYTNAGTPFDWSTALGGGYIGAVSDDAMNYAIGAIVPLYGEIFVFGQRSKPFLAKLTGSSPTDYALPAMFQGVYSTYKTAIGTVNDIWFASDSGVDALSGVQEYGDLRTFSQSDPVRNILDESWDDDNTVATYNSIDGQYWIVPYNYGRVLVAHTKRAMQDENGRTRYPWVEYLFVKDILTSASYKWTKSGSGTNEYYVQIAAGGDPSISSPKVIVMDDSILTEGTVGSLSDHEWDYGDNDTLGYSTVYLRDDSGDPDTTGVSVIIVLVPTAFALYLNTFFIAGDDGYIYKLDPSVLTDNGHDFPPLIGSKLYELAFSELNLDRYNLLCSGQGGTLHLQVYDENTGIDDLHSSDPDHDKTITISTRTDGTLNMNVLKFMVYLRQMDLGSAGLKVHKLLIEANNLSK